MAPNQVPITVAHGDGIGPEIKSASLHIVREAAPRLEVETRFEESFWTNRSREGFVAADRRGIVTHQHIVNLPDRMQKAGLDFIKTEDLYTFDGQKRLLASQGE